MDTEPVFIDSVCSPTNSSRFLPKGSWEVASNQDTDILHFKVNSQFQLPSSILSFQIFTVIFKIRLEKLFPDKFHVPVGYATFSL